ncbi:hypothetical protein L3X38_020598 [Prunus dulcis]|uniref:Uncharacterized protein n=1 Tax=Prunus dulcis TaxID=3755 RepID=A0AAD4WDD5_PRUDU|nr:hypothetical protein L3X38_020598 [Prunus dulcis]
MGCSDPDISSHPQEESDYNELPISFRLDIDVQRDCRSSKDSSAERSPAVIDHEHDSPRECQSPKGSSFEKRQVVIDTEHEYQSPIPSSIDKNQVEIDREECETSVRAGMAMKGEECIYVVPQVGVEFESEDHPYNCYSRYAVLEGFGIRKDCVNKSRINGIVVSRRYTCHLEFPEEKHSPYLIYNATLYFSSAVQKQYFEKYRLGQMIPVAANDVAFAIHAVLLTAITLYQIAIYERGNQKVPKISIGIVAAMWLGSWVNFYGHIGKTLLFLVSIFFDLLFMGQHYVLYRGKRAVITPKIISKESLDPLVKSSDAPVSENV